ncbi:MAG TPA: peptidoglycan DD-metalloendopeptidase family protein [Membranihabitans sp.]|nr:peptidoglycan DD-metalloendopeptidase family protein [Membranihabitans sp.]
MTALQYHLKFPIVTLILLWFLASNLGAQEVQKLESQRDLLITEIKETNRLLQLNQKKSGSINHQYQLISNQIDNREKLIKTYNNEIAALDRSTRDLTQEIKAGESKLVRIRNEYGKLLYQMHRSELVQNKLLLLLSSASLNQAFVRWQYFRQISAYRKTQKEEIEELKQSLEDKRNKITEQKAAVLERRKDIESEKVELALELKKQDDVLQELKSNIGSLRNEIARKERQREELNRRIAALIAEKSKSMPASPAVTALSSNFAKNKGKLPWPTTQGVIVKNFGQQSHPLIKNIKIENDGVDIQVDPGSTIRSVFDGTVVKALYIGEFNMVVVVNHGSYFTVYSNLKEVYVSENQKVSREDPLGIVGENRDGVPVLHFELWNKMKPQNPSQWILRQ